MSAGPSLALEKAPRRGFPRYPVKVPLDVIALRSGVPHNLPGRCADLSEGGVGAMVAGEFSVGQQVAIELRLPQVGLPLRATAQVRYQTKLRCGFEFIGMTAEQREMIRYWAHRLAAEQASRERTISKAESAEVETTPLPRKTRTAEMLRRLRRVSLVATFAVTALAAVGWWQWQRAWNELEQARAELREPLRVSPDAMATRILAKVEPVYPEEARRAGTQGLAVLDAVIAADGTVKRLRPVSGDDLLVQSAADAVRQWRFEPYRQNQQALEVETTIAVEFRLN